MGKPTALCAEATPSLSAVEQRGLFRMMKEQGRYQENIEKIVADALSDVKEDAHPEDMQSEWLTRFFADQLESKLY